eukprot:g7851.t1
MAASSGALGGATSRPQQTSNPQPNRRVVVDVSEELHDNSASSSALGEIQNNSASAGSRAAAGAPGAATASRSLHKFGSSSVQFAPPGRQSLNAWRVGAPTTSSGSKGSTSSSSSTGGQQLQHPPQVVSASYTGVGPGASVMAGTSYGGAGVLNFKYAAGTVGGAVGGAVSGELHGNWIRPAQPPMLFYQTPMPQRSVTGGQYHPIASIQEHDVMYFDVNDAQYDDDEDGKGTTTLLELQEKMHLLKAELKQAKQESSLHAKNQRLAEKKAYEARSSLTEARKEIAQCQADMRKYWEENEKLAGELGEKKKQIEQLHLKLREEKNGKHQAAREVPYGAWSSSGTATTSVIPPVTVSLRDLSEIKALKKPPEPIQLLFKACCLYLGIEPNKKFDKHKKWVYDYWEPARKSILSDTHFMHKLRIANPGAEVLNEIREMLEQEREFSEERVGMCCRAARPLFGFMRERVSMSGVAGARVTHEEELVSEDLLAEDDNMRADEEGESGDNKHFDRVLQSGHGSAEQRKQETVQAVESLLRAESGVRVTSDSDQQQAQGQQGITRFLELLIDSDRFQSYEIRAVFGQIADAVEKTIARGGAAGASNAAQSDTIEATLRFILDKIARKSRLSRGFEDEDAKLRYSLAEMLTGQRKKLEAAQVLTQMKLFDIVAPAADKEKQVNTEKVRAYVRIAELALDIGSKDLLDNYSARAGMLQHLIDDRLLDLRYRSCHARLLDSRSKFGDAAVRYVEVLRDCQELLSTATRTAGAAPPNRTAPPQLSDTERQELLSLQKDVVENAVACACLAPAGVGRTRLLGALDKEPRVVRDASVCGFVHVLLEDRILTSDEAKRMQELAGPTWPEITEILTNGDRTYGIQTLYRALFAVKQQGVNTETNIALLERSLRRTAHRESVLFRHECCYLLGQFGADSSCFTSKKLAFEALFEILTDEGEDEVTRHEAAEGIAAVLNNNVEHLESEVIAFFEKLGRTNAPGEGDVEQVDAALLQSGSDTEDDMQQDENVVSDRTGSRTEPNKLKVHNDHDEKFSATTKALFRRRNARLIELLQRYFDEKTDEASGPAEQVRRFPALAETCFLAVEGLKRETARVCACQYASYDPALGYPNASEQDIPALWQQLKKRASATSSTTSTPTSLRSSSTEDADRGLFSRYRAMFTLRNLNAVAPLADVLRTDQTSPVLRHEIAFILGQMEDEEAVAALVANLEDVHEHPMARHESAIALGSIGGEAAKAGLLRFVEDGEQMVAESCLVALDTIEYWEMWEREEKRIRG